MLVGMYDVCLHLPVGLSCFFCDQFRVQIFICVSNGGWVVCRLSAAGIRVQAKGREPSLLFIVVRIISIFVIRSVIPIRISVILIIGGNLLVRIVVGGIILGFVLVSKIVEND